MASRSSRSTKRKADESSNNVVSLSNSQVVTEPKQPKSDAAVTENAASDVPSIDLTANGDGTTHAVVRKKLSHCLSVDPVPLQPGKDPSQAVNIAVSSRALFDTGINYDWTEEPGKFSDYLDGIMRTEADPFPPGAAFPFIQALSQVNKCLLAINPTEQERFNVILMSHNHAHVGIKLINSINHHALYIERMCLTGGATPVPHYLEAYNVSLFLTSYPNEVEKALECGFAAAALSNQEVKDSVSEELRVAFDLDAVLFSAESEVHYKTGGLKAFFKHEKANRNKLVEEGPLKKFAQALGRMQKKFNDNPDIVKKSPIKVYVVTARSAASSGERAIKTLRAWGIRIDEIHFLAGAPKGPILNAIQPHIFFDDQHTHIDSAKKYGISAAQVGGE
ncbi:cytosolic 5'-nucleotidase 1A-like [Watersipora subatra]|uniref:cytosolic 5'-nucleotidase 1A-like n=1 Tax=Watersipora subatra TaxID=2589382 RepID=UPI00355BBF44